MYFNVNSAYHVVRQYITRLKELPSIKRFVRFNCNRFRGVFMKNTIESAFHTKERLNVLVFDEYIYSCS